MTSLLSRRALISGATAFALAAPSLARAQQRIERATLRFHHDFLDSAPLQLDLRPYNSAAFSQRRLSIVKVGQTYRIVQEEGVDKPSNLMLSFRFKDSALHGVTQLEGTDLGAQKILISRRVGYRANIVQRLSPETVRTMGLLPHDVGLFDIGLEAGQAVDFEHSFDTGRLVLTYKVANAKPGLSIRDSKGKVTFEARGEVSQNGPPITTFTMQQPVPARHSYNRRFALYEQGDSGPKKLFDLPDASPSMLQKRAGGPDDVYHATVFIAL